MGARQLERAQRGRGGGAEWRRGVAVQEGRGAVRWARARHVRRTVACAPLGALGRGGAVVPGDFPITADAGEAADVFQAGAPQLYRAQRGGGGVALHPGVCPIRPLRHT